MAFGGSTTPTDEPTRTFVPGSLSTGIIGTEEREQAEREGRAVGGNIGALMTEFEDPFAIIDGVLNTMEDDLVRWGNENGYNSEAMKGFMDAIASQLAIGVNSQFRQGLEYDQEISSFLTDEITGSDAFQQINLRGSFDYYFTPDGLMELVDNAWSQAQGIWSGLGDRPTGDPVGSGGGGGRRSPTPEEIRNQYDLDQLTNDVNSLWRTWLLEEHSNPRKLASDYVEAIVATKGEKAIDFQTFVRSRAQSTSRWASVYRKKPQSMSEEQFLQPYFAAASQVLRPKNAAGVAIGGAQFGADAGSFQANLARQNENVTSAPFINGIQERLSAVKGLFKG